MNFGEYITPEHAKQLGDKRSIVKLRRAAKRNHPCDVCGQPEWKFGGLRMCFVCTTGESDASKDYELKP